MLQAGARHQQAVFRRALLHEIHRAPEFVLADIVADDDFGAGLDDVADDRLQAGVAARLIETGGLVEQGLDFRGLYEARIHVVSPLF